MPITPDPNTTEWVPLWNLNGTSGPPSTHHNTHEPGGNDFLVNSVWTNQQNIFTQPQIISYSQPELRLSASDQPADARVWRILDAGYLLFQATNDAISAQQAAMYIDRNGILTVPNGLGTTPLNASYINAGTIPDANLSSNVALKNIDNHFVPQTFGSYSVINGPNSLLGFIDTSAGLNQKVFRILNDGSGNFYIQSLDDAQSNVLQSWTFVGNGAFVSPGGLGATPLNASQLLSGTVPLARLPPSISSLTYEEGYFTPVLGGTGGEQNQAYAPGFQAGNYVKIGNFVHAGIYIQFTDCGQIFGNLVVKDLPYNSGGGSSTHAAAIGYITNLASPGTKNPRRNVHGYMLAATSMISLFSGDDLNADLGNMIQMTGADVNIHTQITLSISYRTNY